MPRKLSLRKDVLVELTPAEAAQVAGARTAPSLCEGVTGCLCPVIVGSLHQCLTIHAGCSWLCTD